MTADERQTRPIVVGVDGSKSSKDALRWAERLAGPLGAYIDAVTVWDYPKSYGPWGVYPGNWRPDRDAAQIVENALAEVFGEDRPMDLVVTVRQGHPSAVLMAASENAEMLVVGSRGHGGFVGMLLGSVSAACAEHAKCPVLVVHDSGDGSATTRRL